MATAFWKAYTCHLVRRFQCNMRLQRPHHWRVCQSHWLRLREGITCKRGSAAVVRTSCCSYGKHQILHLSRDETTEPINTKFWAIDYLGDKKGITKFGSDRFKDSVSPSGWNVQFSCFFLSGSSFRLQTTIRNGFWCIMAQKIRFGARMCLLSIHSLKS